MENIGPEKEQVKENFFETSIYLDLCIIGRARISPHPSFVVDVFVTHTCAIGPDYSNAYYREHQVQVGKLLSQ